MRIDSEHADARVFYVQLSEGSMRGARCALDQFGRDPPQRRVQPLMQGDMDDTQSAANEHQEDILLRDS